MICWQSTRWGNFMIWRKTRPNHLRPNMSACLFDLHHTSPCFCPYVSTLSLHREGGTSGIYFYSLCQQPFQVTSSICYLPFMWTVSLNSPFTPHTYCFRLCFQLFHVSNASFPGPVQFLSFAHIFCLITCCQILTRSFTCYLRDPQTDFMLVHIQKFLSISTCDLTAMPQWILLLVCTQIWMLCD